MVMVMLLLLVVAMAVEVKIATSRQDICIATFNTSTFHEQKDPDCNSHIPLASNQT